MAKKTALERQLEKMREPSGVVAPVVPDSSTLFDDSEINIPDPYTGTVTALTTEPTTSESDMGEQAGMPRDWTKPSVFKKIMDAAGKGARFMMEEPGALEDVALPLAGAIESLASGGVSPGTVSMSLRDQMINREKEKMERAEQKSEYQRKARERELLKQLGRADITNEERMNILRELYPKEIALKEMDIGYKKEALTSKERKEALERDLKSTKDSYTKTQKLRNEFSKESDDFKDIYRAKRRLEFAANNPSAAGDIALLYGFMRLLDPASTVREGEYATAAQAGSAGERILGLYNRLLTGQRLTDRQRADFQRQAAGLFRSREDEYRRQKGYYTNLSQRYGINPYEVLGWFEEEQMPEFVPDNWTVEDLETTQAAARMGDQDAQKLLIKEGASW